MILAEEYGWKVVGIECDKSHCQKAMSKAAGVVQTGDVQFVQMSVDANSGPRLWDLIPRNQVCGHLYLLAICIRCVCGVDGKSRF